MMPFSNKQNKALAAKLNTKYTKVRRKGGAIPGEAHEKALKATEMDAIKRAFSTFGNPFGLALYDKDEKRVRH
jgi:recombination DNA repair RAD52 pathway protein